MQKQIGQPTKQDESEPLFINFANFKFKHDPLEDFFTMLNRAGVQIPLEELSIYHPTEDQEYINARRSLTKIDEEKILEDLKSDQKEFKNLLSKLVRKNKDDKEDKLHFFLDKGNPYCYEVPIQFTYHKKYPGKLEIASPALDDIEEVGWAYFILGLMAVDLGKYLMENSVTKIRLCKKKDCKKFFTLRGGNAIFCSDYCKNKSHHNARRDSGYFRRYMKERRIKGIYQRKDKRIVKTEFK